MKINKKVPAFTLMEVTISMLIAAIAIAITYTAYHIISGTYSNYTKKQDRLASFTVADQLIKKDFLEADQVLRAGEELTLHSSAGLIIYEFKENYLVRHQYSLHADTFKIIVKDPGYFFEGVSVQDGAIVDQLIFHTVLEGEDIPLYYQKMYSAQDLLN